MPRTVTKPAESDRVRNEEGFGGCDARSHAGHEAPLVAPTLGRTFVRGRLIRLIGDKAYDSNKLDATRRFASEAST
ncbi:hypothetical protein BH11MYX1_BH11MYX1_02770 [soil metagenome]